MVEFLALRCYSCGMFQVKPRKKSSAWRCSVCNASQSITKVYGTGNAAKKIRELVQSLNCSTLSQQEDRFASALEEIADVNHCDHGELAERNVGGCEAAPSKWVEFLETEDLRYGTSPIEEDSQYVTCIPEGARKRKTIERSRKDHESKDNPGSMDKNQKRTSFVLEEPTMSKFSSRNSKMGKENTESDRLSKSKGSTTIETMGGSRKQDGDGLRSSAQTLSKWTRYLEVDEETPSKWSNCLDTDKDLCNKAQVSSRKWCTAQQSPFCEAEVQTELADELVIEDVHPSFL